MRLIDADALYEFHVSSNNGEDPSEFFKGWNCCIKHLTQYTDTIDAAPVVHARWEWSENLPVTDDDDPDCICRAGYACSSCGYSDGTSVRLYEQASPATIDVLEAGLWESTTPFCPHCGAKMDGGAGNAAY